MRPFSPTKMKVPKFKKNKYFELFEQILYKNYKKKSYEKRKEDEKPEEEERVSLWGKIARKIFTPNTKYKIRGKPASEMEVKYISHKANFILNQIALYSAKNSYNTDEALKYYIVQCKLEIKFRHLKRKTFVAKAGNEKGFLQKILETQNTEKEEESYQAFKMLTGEVEIKKVVDHINSQDYKKGEFCEGFLETKKWIDILPNINGNHYNHSKIRLSKRKPKLNISQREESSFKRENIQNRVHFDTIPTRLQNKSRTQNYTLNYKLSSVESTSTFSGSRSKPKMARFKLSKKYVQLSDHKVINFLAKRDLFF